jgi:SAM-dependent methyltransferase
LARFKFEEFWGASNQQDLFEVQKFWDLRAEEFNNIREEQKEKFELIQLLLSKGLIKNDYDVLDIGCGTGKYALELAKVAKHVIGIDISPKMIRYAEQNAKSMNLKNTNFKVIAWQNLNVKQMNWNKKFDLVFASMSPAISSKKDLIKMIEASRKYCFMSGFVYRKDKVKDELIKRIIGKERTKSFEKNIYCAFNILWNMGIYPEITYKDVVWNKKMSSEKATEIYTILLKKMAKNDDSIQTKVQAYIEEISNDGKIEESIEAKIAWMLWNVDL